jgi:hypothetical protein
MGRRRALGSDEQDVSPAVAAKSAHRHQITLSPSLRPGLQFGRKSVQRVLGHLAGFVVGIGLHTNTCARGGGLRSAPRHHRKEPIGRSSCAWAASCRMFNGEGPSKQFASESLGYAAAKRICGVRQAFVPCLPQQSGRHTRSSVHGAQTQQYGFSSGPNTVLYGRPRGKQYIGSSETTV